MIYYANFETYRPAKSIREQDPKENMSTIRLYQSIKYKATLIKLVMTCGSKTEGMQYKTLVKPLLTKKAKSKYCYIKH